MALGTFLHAVRGPAVARPGRVVIRAARRGRSWPVPCVLALGIQVQLANHRSDAINVLDWVADSVAAATEKMDTWITGQAAAPSSRIMKSVGYCG